jgi:hypothetical protein
VRVCVCVCVHVCVCSCVCVHVSPIISKNSSNVRPVVLKSNAHGVKE